MTYISHECTELPFRQCILFSMLYCSLGLAGHGGATWIRRKRVENWNPENAL
jgi:hypothetical protein